MAESGMTCKPRNHVPFHLEDVFIRPFRLEFNLRVKIANPDVHHINLRVEH